MTAYRATDEEVTSLTEVVDAHRSCSWIGGRNWACGIYPSRIRRGHQTAALTAWFEEQVTIHTERSTPMPTTETLTEIAERLRNYAVAPTADLTEIADQLDGWAGVVEKVRALHSGGHTCTSEAWHPPWFEDDETCPTAALLSAMPAAEEGQP